MGTSLRRARLLALLVLAPGAGSAHAGTPIQIGCTATTHCASAALPQAARCRTPGIGAFLDVLFRRWLIQHGVDPKQVAFVEVTFPTMNDVLKSGAVDAVVTAEPVLSRIVKAGTGTVAANFMADLPAKEPQILYAATRTWADANPTTVEQFRAAIAEAAADVNANPDRARAALSHFTKLPLDLVSTMKLSVSDPVVTDVGLAWWIDTMKEQDMLQGSPDVKGLLAR